MKKYLAIKVSESYEVGQKYSVTEEMIKDAPEFDTQEEASSYCDLIDPDFLWVIMPTE